MENTDQKNKIASVRSLSQQEMVEHAVNLTMKELQKKYGKFITMKELQKKYGKFITFENRKRLSKRDIQQKNRNLKSGFRGEYFERQ